LPGGGDRELGDAADRVARVAESGGCLITLVERVLAAALCTLFAGFCGSAAWARGKPGGLELVEYSTQAAVFKRGDVLLLIRLGEKVPNTIATVLHIDDAGVSLEYPASRASVGGVMRLARDQVAPPEWPDDAPASVLVPSMTVTISDQQTSAGTVTLPSAGQQIPLKQDQ